MRRPYRIRATPYVAIVEVLFSSPEDGTKWLRGCGDESVEVTDDDHGLTIIGTRGYVSTWLQDPTDVATLAHEMVHAAVAVLERAGVLISPENDEALAYLVEHLMREVGKRIARDAAKRDSNVIEKPRVKRGAPQNRDLPAMGGEGPAPKSPSE